MSSSVRPELDSLRELFPLKLGSVEIELLDRAAEARHPNADEVWGTVRVITYEANGWVRDILEQDVRLAPHRNLLADIERVRQAIEAHAEVLTELFARPGVVESGAYFPAELMYLDDVLTLRKASSREQFAVALRARKRLGKRLG